ncbi:MAG: hypothetical protein HY649_09105 [Acidobacteria bacterium]|nr:hypothetical protein [Acidobacteriota bacterium]
MKRFLVACLFTLYLALNVQAADFKNMPVGAPFDWATTGTYTFNNAIIDASGKRVAWILQARVSCAISALGVRYGARTGTPPTYRISAQGVGAANGDADTTVKGATNNALATFTPPADTTWDGTIQYFTLGETYTPGRGEFFSIVVDYSSGTIDGSNNSSFTRSISNLGVGRSAFPYSETFSGASWTKGTDSFPVFTYKCGSSVYGYPIQTFTATSYSSSSSPDEYALKFTLDSGWGNTFTAAGIRCSLDTPPVDVLVTLYDSDGTTTLQDVTWDSDADTGFTIKDAILLFNETSLSALNFGTAYRIGFAPQNTTAGFALRTVDVAAAGDMAAFGGGTSFILSTRTDAGAWTDDDTKRPLCELIIDDWTEPAASGGASSYTFVQ